MLYLPFNVYLDSKRVSILIEAVWPTLPMLYLPFNVYLDSKRVSVLIEAVWPTLPMLYLPSYFTQTVRMRPLKCNHLFFRLHSIIPSPNSKHLEVVQVLFLLHCSSIRLIVFMFVFGHSTNHTISQVPTLSPPLGRESAQSWWQNKQRNQRRCHYSLVVSLP